MQTFAIIVSLAVTAVAVTLTVLAVRSMLRTLRIGGPMGGRTDQPARRTWTMVKETMGHTRMLQWTWVGILHWFVYAGFIVLSGAVATGYFQLFDPEFALPFIGHFFLYEWVSEGLGLLSTIGIVGLIVYRQLNHPRRLGRRSRFYGSNFWQGYFVEAMALLEGSAILFIRGAEYNLGQIDSDHPEDFDRFHFPISSTVGEALFPQGLEENAHTLENIIVVIAMIKILLAMVWLMVIARNLTMGVAWHRFTAWFNIWFKREGSGRTALGAMKPLTSDGKAITLDDIDDLDEDSKLGVGAVEDFSWKGILDFTTCTECGRCQSQCPAWNTDKPLSPKLLITALRDATYAKAPYLQAAEEDRPALLEGSDTLTREAERPLVAPTGGRMDGLEDGEWFYMPENGAAVIDPDVLWSCTSCGACVQQCPVDIEHVDHIMDMRRYQVLVESNFPAELNGLFKGLENKGNPWNMSPNARMDWAKGLDFEVKVVGETIESLDEVDWLFWVGCAGAYEDRAKKTTRAVAELLDMAGVTFGVLGNGETCTGDPARRAGNEFVFQGLAQQNVETLKEYKVKKVVSTCAHCFNTLKNEYKEFGIELEVVHHTQLLNRLVREGRLTPVRDGAGAHQRTITYHDPCYIGRHNGVYTPPRELLQILPGAEVVEMERNSERSFCCGAGGARMWMEENLGERINVNRTVEAVGTGADQIAVGCPFCRVMLSDGLTAQQAKGEAREEVEVLDVAQMLLASVKGEMATKLAPGAGTAAPAKLAEAKSAQRSVETKAEPEAGDETITDDTVVATEDTGPAAKASGGSSLFDDASSMFDEPDAKAAPETASEDKAPAEEARAAKPASSGGSLFDLGDASSESEPDAEPVAKAAPEPKAEAPAPKSGGSLFDIQSDEPAAPAEPEAEAEPAEAEPAEEFVETPSAKPAADLASGGSLFDIQADEPAAPAEPEAEAEPAEEPVETPSAKPAADLASGGSLFDIQADEPEPEPAAPTRAAESAPAAKADPEPSPKAEPGPATPPIDLSSGGSLFDIAAPEPAPEAKAEPEPEPTEEPTAETEPTAKTAPAATTVEPATEVDFDNLGSLFDIEAPEPVAAPTPAAAAEPESTPESTPDSASEPAAESTPGPETEPAQAENPGAQLSAVATAAASDETTPETEPEGKPEPEPVDEPEPEPAPKDKPTSSDAAHQPRTDVDIKEGSSLFDL
jgi:Fe-S oxidoreductase